jgi:hypothetical protein
MVANVLVNEVSMTAMVVQIRKSRCTMDPMEVALTGRGVPRAPIMVVGSVAPALLSMR